MKLKIFYHIVDLFNWREIADEQMGKIFDSGLIDHCELYANLHYDHNSFDEFKEKWNHPNIKWINSTGLPGDMEFPTWILMQETAKSNEEEFYCLYLHLKAVTHLGKWNENNVHDWRRYLDWFNIVNWRHMVSKLDEGIWDTVGVNRQTAGRPDKNGKERYYYAGNILWYSSRFLKEIPTLKWPSEVDYQSQIPNTTFLFREDVEFYAGWNGDRGYSFYHANRNHYLQDCPESLYINFFKNK